MAVANNGPLLNLVIDFSTSLLLVLSKRSLGHAIGLLRRRAPQQRTVCARLGVQVRTWKKNIWHLLTLFSFITNSGNYERNHGPIPHIAAAEHLVKVNGQVHRPLQISIEQLKSRYTQHEIISALQCAGNRRHTMRTLLKEVNGIDWGDGAVMNCRWKGPKLKDVLNDAGIKVHDLKGVHVAFACYKTHVQGSEWYGGSIELDRALRDSADVLIALEVFLLCLRILRWRLWLVDERQATFCQPRLPR